MAGNFGWNLRNELDITMRYRFEASCVTSPRGAGCGRGTRCIRNGNYTGNLYFGHNYSTEDKTF